MARRCWLGLLLLVASASAWADGLLSLYREALMDSPHYRGAEASYAADRAGVAMARGRLLPSLSLSLSNSKANTNSDVAGKMSNYSYIDSNYSLNLRQSLYRPGTWAQYKQAKAQRESGMWNSLSAGNEMYIDLITAYTDALFAEDQEKFIDAQVKLAREDLAMAERQFATGFGTRIDVDEARAHLDVTQSQRLDYESQEKDALRRLGAMVGRAVDSIPPLASNPISTELLPSIHTWLTLAQENNPDCRRLLAQVGVAQQEVRRLRADHLPTVDLVASLGQSQNDNVTQLSLGNSVYRTNSVGIQVSVPIYSGGQVDAEVQQALAKLEVAQEQLEEARRKVDVHVQGQYDLVVQAELQEQALHIAELSAMQVVVSERMGIKGGERTTRDVLDAEKRLYSVRRDLAKVRYERIMARNHLQALTTIIDEEYVEKAAEVFAD